MFIIFKKILCSNFRQNIFLFAGQGHFQDEDLARTADLDPVPAQLNIGIIAELGEEVTIAPDSIIITAAEDSDKENTEIFEIIAEETVGIIAEMVPDGIIEVMAVEAAAVGEVIDIEIIVTKAVRDIVPDQEVADHMIVKKNDAVPITKANVMVNVNLVHNH